MPHRRRRIKRDLKYSWLAQQYPFKRDLVPGSINLHKDDHGTADPVPGRALGPLERQSASEIPSLRSPKTRKG